MKHSDTYNKYEEAHSHTSHDPGSGYLGHDPGHGYLGHNHEPSHHHNHHCNCQDSSDNSDISSCDCHPHHHHHDGGGIHAFIPSILSGAMLLVGLILRWCNVESFTSHRWVEFGWYLLAFLPVGLPVIKEAIEGIRARDYFNEFTLMVIACIGAFCIWELPEAVGVMLFYSIGETLQHGAVDRATHNISRLLDVRSEQARVLRDNQWITVRPQEVKIGETIEIGPSERVPLDGIITSPDGGTFDTSALTGESLPRDIPQNSEVLAGMISSQRKITVKVTREYADSALSRILAMVKDASSRKAQPELFIRKFARIYTPIVIVLALLVVAVPAIVGAFSDSFTYHFSEWLYRALVFLVISCPCALVISVPLGYFAGIGAASRNGILFKGGNYLEAITHINTVAFDKTGTLTTGRFSVVRVDGDEAMLRLMAAAENGSSHPLAKAVVEYSISRNINIPVATSMNERAGQGVIAEAECHRILAGNTKLLVAEGITYPAEVDAMADTFIVCAIDGNYAGCVLLSDTLKPDASEAVDKLHQLGIERVAILSGDRQQAVARIASQISVDEYHAEMLPLDKAEYVEKAAKTPGCEVAFVGDGMNDAPVLALSDVGIAMGGLGSDAAIESADVVIQTDQPSRVATAIRIGRTTHTIVMENIIGAIAIKVAILLLGALGYASLWAAVFADVGVALLAVLNSMRILHKRY